MPSRDLSRVFIRFNWMPVSDRIVYRQKNWHSRELWKLRSRTHERDRRRSSNVERQLEMISPISPPYIHEYKFPFLKRTLCTFTFFASNRGRPGASVQERSKIESACGLFFSLPLPKIRSRNSNTVPSSIPQTVCSVEDRRP